MININPKRGYMIIEGWNLNLYLKKKKSPNLFENKSVRVMLKFLGAFRFLLLNHISECIKISVFFLSTALVLQNVFFFFFCPSVLTIGILLVLCFFFFFETTVHIIEVQSVGFLFMYLFHSSLIYFNCWYLSCQTIDITCFIYDIFQLKVMLLYVDVNIDLVFCSLGLWSLLCPCFLILF